MTKKFIYMMSIGIYVFLNGCASMSNEITKFPADVVRGPKVTENATPYTAALYCEDMTADSDKVWVAVGKIPDLTGKFTNEDGGYKITQGAQMMMQSALSRMSDHVGLVERIDPSVFQFETNLAVKKLLGDGTVWDLGNGKTANWRMIKTGSVKGSEYYITGAITELNYNIQSGGAELGIDGIGGGARKYVLSIAGDFRLVDTKTTEVISSVTVQKQVVGYEVKADIFNFFGTVLVDFNAGAKNNEPIQLAVRSLTEVAATKLLPSIIHSESSCLERVENLFDEDYTMVMNDPKRAALKVVSDLHFESITPPENSNESEGKLSEEDLRDLGALPSSKENIKDESLELKVEGPEGTDPAKIYSLGNQL